MSCISISAPTYDLQGNVMFRFDPDSELVGETRRVSRRATLDGGVAITDQGFSHGDRTFRIRKTNISRAVLERLRWLQRTYSTLNISVPDGAFRGVIQSLSVVEGELRLNILIKEKLS